MSLAATMEINELLSRKFRWKTRDDDDPERMKNKTSTSEPLDTDFTRITLEP